MKCPVCKTDLIVEGLKRLETLDEHVSCQEPSLKKSYVCPNESCDAHNMLNWNEWGERYNKIGCSFNQKFNFIGGNDAPFGTFQRKTNVEIYKKDENRYLYRGKIWKVELCYSYQSDDDGNILNRTPHLKFWKENTLYISGIRMLIYSIKQFHKQLRFNFRSKEDLLEFNEWEKKDWWRVWAHQYKTLYFKIFTKEVA